MSLVKISTLVMALSLTVAPASLMAGPKGGAPKTTTPAAKAPTVKASPVKGTSGTTSAPKATAPAKSPKTTKVTAPSTGKSAKTTAPATAKPTKTDAKLAKVDAKSAKADAKSARVEAKAEKKNPTTSTSSTTTASDTTSGTTTGSGTTTTTEIDFTSSPAGSKLAKNSALRTKLESRLTALGYEGTVYEAAYGFKNQGQFVAATNVANNLGVSFEQIKLQMTGLSVDATGTVLQANRLADGTIVMVDPADVTNAAPTKSLGQAIKSVSSTVDATTAANTATTQANAEIQSTTTVSK